MNVDGRCWAVMPAAGVGSRMGGAVPKQYLPLNGRPVIEHGLQRLLAHPAIEQVFVVISAADDRWAHSDFSSHPRIRQVAGGNERCHSVLNALRALRQVAGPEDWVLTHDAARPCLRAVDIDRLLEELSGDSVGGVLAIPLHDTIKQCDDACRVVETLPREHLWRALTPQMFRLSRLQSALEHALTAGLVVTDESSAMELAGYQPRLVQGQSDNIKITQPGDLELAALFLERQQRSREDKQ